ncbi:MAG: F0F1 ATP synthase subunit delta [Helicobacteraceae bacterium]|jgi:F-type H+-transporting ATPase subunit delta|nr:F0F1 ATP synthase subunit delta [Helicobacteraceae bacterium]
MNDKLVAKRYAQALIAATNEKELVKILSLLDDLSSLFSNKKFAEIVKSPLISNADKVDLIGLALSEKPVKLINLLSLLVEKNRLSALPYIVKEAQAAIAGKRSAYNGVVDAQAPIEKTKLEALAKSLTKRLGAEIKLTQSKRPYNGVRVAIDDLGVEVDFSKARIRSQILGHILRGL